MISLRAAIFCCRKGSMADSFFFTVTGWRWSIRRDRRFRWPAPAGAIELNSGAVDAHLLRIANARTRHAAGRSLAIAASTATGEAPARRPLRRTPRAALEPVDRTRSKPSARPPDPPATPPSAAQYTSGHTTR